MSACVDHIIIAVSDLEVATRDYAYAGARSGLAGRHPDYGSANTLFVLDNTYLGCWPPRSGWAGDRVTQHIADKGQGLMGLVFGVDEIGRLLTNPQSRAGH